MRKLEFALAAMVGMILAAPVHAEEADPPPSVTISGGATVISDYRFRGISQSNRRAAIQGTATISHKSGFYASVWGSSIDDYIADNVLGWEAAAGKGQQVSLRRA